MKGERVHYNKYITNNCWRKVSSHGIILQCNSLSNFERFQTNSGYYCTCNLRCIGDVSAIYTKIAIRHKLIEKDGHKVANKGRQQKPQTNSYLNSQLQ